MFDQTKRIRGGFTLVELMVVIVIIIILMGLLTPVLINVMARGAKPASRPRSARSTALKAYRVRYGAYSALGFYVPGRPGDRASASVAPFSALQSGARNASDSDIQ